jgi:hypothetical protein
VRKTREQVWRELDELGEVEVRARLAERPEEEMEPAHVREWLERQARVESALAETSSDLATRLVGGVQTGREERRSGSPVVGVLILIAAASFAVVRSVKGREA